MLLIKYQLSTYTFALFHALELDTFIRILNNYTAQIT